MRTASFLSAGLALASALLPSQASADNILASAEISALLVGGGEYEYTITLQNTGATAIGTLWNAWTPGQDFMAVSPTNIVSPTNWSAAVTHAGAGDGYAIEWTTSSALLAPGNTLTFKFESTATPAAMAANSVFYPTTPVETSFVYSGAPFSDAGEQFVVQSVPEPSPAALLELAAIGLFVGRQGRRSAAVPVETAEAP